MATSAPAPVLYCVEHHWSHWHGTPVALSDLARTLDQTLGPNAQALYTISERLNSRGVGGPDNLERELRARRENVVDVALTSTTTQPNQTIADVLAMPRRPARLSATT